MVFVKPVFGPLYRLGSIAPTVLKLHAFNMFCNGFTLHIYLGRLLWRSVYEVTALCGVCTSMK